MILCRSITLIFLFLASSKIVVDFAQEELAINDWLIFLLNFMALLQTKSCSKGPNVGVEIGLEEKRYTVVGVNNAQSRDENTYDTL